jgi:hypothetical protein
VLWFEYEMSSMDLCVECMVPSWWYILGGSGKFGSMAYIEEVGDWGLKAIYLSPVLYDLSFSCLS